MPRTPPRTHPARPLAISGGVRHGKEKRRSKAKAGGLAASRRAEPTLGCISIRYRIVDSVTDSSTHGVDLPCRPRSTPTNSCRNLSKAGHCGFAGCEPHGCGDQAPRTGLRRPRKPTVPRHPAGSPLLLRLLLLLQLLLQLLPLRVPGATRPNPFPQGQAGGAAAQACCTSASDARSSSRHCGNSCAWWALVLHCVGSVRTAAAYHCTASCFCPSRHSASA